MKRFARPLLIVGILMTIATPVFGAKEPQIDTIKATTSDITEYRSKLDNTYVAGPDFAITKNVGGDLVTAGGNISINVPVKQDVLAAGGTILLNADIGGDARVAGGTLVINSSTNGDLVAIGGNISMMSNSVVRGELMMGGGQITIAGTVNGASQISSGSANISGTLKGKTSIDADQIALTGTIDGDAIIVAKRILLGSNAMLRGNVRYWLPEGERDAFESSPQIKGTVTFDPSLQNRNYEGPSKRVVAGALASLFIGFELYMLAAMALVMLILVLASKTFFQDAARELLTKPWKNLLTGFLYFAATPVACFILLLTFIGIPLAVTLMAIYVFSLAFAKAISAVVFAEMLSQRRKVRFSTFLLFVLSVVAYIVLKIVGLLPIIGWIFSAAAVCLAYGSVLTIKWERWKKVR